MPLYMIVRAVWSLFHSSQSGTPFLLLPISGDYISSPPSEPSELLQNRVGFVFDYTRDDPLDPRELSELPDVRLWFVRLDTAYPWLPAVLDWRAGELGRYAAMLVPHQVGPTA